MRDQIFISYSHKDLRWRDSLLAHLKPVVRQGLVTTWSDEQIQPGAKWREEIEIALGNAKVAVLLVSSDFLNSNFIHEHELAPLLKRAESGGVRILWIPVRASGYESTEIADYQAVISAERPLNQMKTAERDRAWVEICKVIATAATDSATAEADPSIAGRIHPLSVVHPDSRPSSHRPLLRDLERELSSGSLKDSLIAPIVLAVLREEADLELISEYRPDWVTAGIRLSDRYLVPIRLGAGMRDWQRDLAQTATPVLVGVARTLRRSADAQAVLIRLIESVAARLRLRIIWPHDSDELNETANAIYSACLDAHALEDDDVLNILKELGVVGPK